jgi:heat shock protein HtpX
MSNILKTTLLLTSLTLLFVFFGGLAGGRTGMVFAFFLALAMNFFAYWYSDKLVLAAYRAQPVAEAEAPEIYGIVQEIAGEAKLRMPKIYLIPSASPNAFATGRNPAHAAVAVTRGIVELLNREELKGVLAHEMAHVVHYDILISSIAATVAGAIGMLAAMLRWTTLTGGARGPGAKDNNPLVLLVMSIVVPFAAGVIQMAVSRSREFQADAGGAGFCGNPLYLASALKKIAAGSRRYPLHGAKESSAHLFILNPLSGGGFSKLFSTHPPVEERIARLEAMARARGL